ncbi:MAG: DUF2252 domain-containing protein [Candidatus Nanopelagicales bacterium]
MSAHSTAGTTADDIDVQAFFTQRRPSRDARRADGVQRRRSVPLESHAELPGPDDREDPLTLLKAQESSREPALVPLRYARMATDPFAFLRGSAAVMAADLSKTASSGISVQLCGDAHLANFGMFASAERSLVFDLNDFDETHPGPFEWDVKRLAASFAVAARNNGFKDKHATRAARAAVTAYRVTMADLAEMPTLRVWFAELDVDLLVERLRKTALRQATVKAGSKARRSTGDAAVLKLTETVDGQRRFRTDPPLLVPVPPAEFDATVESLAHTYGQYLQTLPPDRIALLMRYSFVDIAHKVVGVGSVGTRALVLLLESGDGDPMLLQVKQANASVLEPYLGASRFDNAGKRVVVGQRVLQTTGDPFLGWTRGGKKAPYDFYVRQLKDMKGSIEPTLLDQEALGVYAQLCGATLARAHARAGDASAISGYLGTSDEFDSAVAEFAMAYADITEHDHGLLTQAIVER